MAIENKIKITFEYTPRYTLQHKVIVERKYQIFYNKMRSMPNTCGLRSYFQRNLWSECANTVTMLDNIVIKSFETDSSYEIFYNKKIKVELELRKFG